MLKIVKVKDEAKVRWTRKGRLKLTESTTDWKRAGLSASLNSSIVLKFLSRPVTAVEFRAEEKLREEESRSGEEGEVCELLPSFVHLRVVSPSLP
jgi:hypothetical protein